jgi:glycosyltransferase involved in cell wall biosynthesis
VDVDRFTFNAAAREEYYLAASRMVPYKKMPLIVEAFSRMPGKRLVVIGDGPEMKQVRAKAGDNIQILGRQPFEVLLERMQRAKGFVFAAEEDFGILPVEAQACGTPVIAFGRGGAVETVLDGQTGLFFNEQSVEALIHAVERFEKQCSDFDPRLIREHALKFSRERFSREILDFVEQKVREKWGSNSR